MVPATAPRTSPAATPAPDVTRPGQARLLAAEASRNSDHRKLALRELVGTSEPAIVAWARAHIPQGDAQSVPLCIVILAIAGALNAAVVERLRRDVRNDSPLAVFLTYDLVRYREHKPVRALAASLFDVPELHVRLLDEMAAHKIVDATWRTAAEAAQSRGAIDEARVRAARYYLDRLASAPQVRRR